MSDTSDFPIAKSWLSTMSQSWFGSGGDQIWLINQLDHLNDKSVVMEIGAYKGDWAKSILQKYNCNIFLYEPFEDAFEHCKNNVGISDKTHFHNYGLSNKNGEVDLYLNNDGSSMSRVSDEKKTIKVVDVVDELNNIGTDIDAMQINIEGAEFDLLDRLLDSGKINNINTLLIQFHTEGGKSDFNRRLDIQKRLADTHTMKFNFDFVWERWDKIK